MASPDQELTEDPKTEEKPAAHAHLISKGKRRKSRRRRRGREKVLTIACPNAGCQKPVQLLCPFCRLGAMYCDEEFLVLSCQNCHSTLHHFTCRHCEFPIKASYIKQKQRTFRRLMKNADGSKFFAVIFIILLAISSLWFILKVYT